MSATRPGQSHGVVEGSEAKRAAPQAFSSAYDALADLFLSEEAFTPGVASALRLVPSDHDEAAEHESSAASEVTDVTDESSDASRVIEPSGERLVELLVVGHLPVLASAWIMPYVRSIAGEAGVITLVRAQRGQVSVELVGEVPQAVREIAGVSDGTLSLAHAMAIAARVTSRVVIRVDTTSEAEALHHSGITDVTLLSGADDAAIVASYRTLKSLGERLAERADETGVTPRVRVAILGADPDRAEAARAKLRQTTAAFLGEEAEIVVGPKRVAGGGTVTLCRGEPAGEGNGAGEIIDMIASAAPAMEASMHAFAGASSSRIGPAAASVVEAKPMAEITHPKASMDAEMLRVKPIETSGSALHALEVGGDTGETPVPRDGEGQPARDLQTLRSREGVASGDVAENERAHVDAMDESRPRVLAEQIEGLVPLKARCPYAPRVELAAGSDGRLHVLAFAGGVDASEGEKAAGPAAVVAELVSVAGWAYDHIDLIRLSCRGVELGADPTTASLHLMTDRPREARRFLDSGVHVHVLARARVGTLTAWVCREMN
ncbi:MAG: hypothetical protein AB7Q00_06880 [Phycisphaerales bacterium]